MNPSEYTNYHETKEHASSDFPYNTYLCSIPLDFVQVPLHWHEAMELIVIKKGKGLVSVDLHTETVFAGDIVLILPGHLHAIEQKESFHMEYENILFDPSMLISGTDDLCAARYIRPPTNAELTTDTFITPALSYYQNISECITEIDRLCDIRPDGYQLAVKGWLFHLFYYLIQNQKNRDSVSNTKTKSLEKMKIILKYVEEHYAEPITLDDISSVTYYSKSHFMKFFKQHMNISFIDYLNNYRLNLAASLLTTTDHSILEIASMVGFDNLSYFNRLFRRKFNTTPGNYRAEIRT